MIIKLKDINGLLPKKMGKGNFQEYCDGYNCALKESGERELSIKICKRCALGLKGKMINRILEIDTCPHCTEGFIVEAKE